MDKRLQAFERLLNIVDEVRAKCPWDSIQTIESIRHLTIEETYELSEAILANDLNDVKKELGDLMLHIALYSKMADEQGVFDIADVLDGISEKMIVRHPHIFGSERVENAEQVSQNCESFGGGGLAARRRSGQQNNLHFRTGGNLFGDRSQLLLLQCFGGTDDVS